MILPSNRWLQRWDVCTMLALVFTALVTPVEVAFVPGLTWWTPLFWVNRCIDLVFVADMASQFFIAYRDDAKTWLREHEAGAVRV